MKIHLKHSISNSFLLLLSLSLFFCSCNKDNEEMQDPIIEEIFTVVEEMPRFQGCEDLGLPNDELKECAHNKMLEFIYDNLEYPPEAIVHETEGTVVIRCVIEKDGSVRNGGDIIQDKEHGLGLEALRVINTMPDFIPGKQRGNPVLVYLNIPVNFEL